jgi:hypothetical protein
MSESHAHHIFPGVMSHISIRSSFVEDNLLAKAAGNKSVDGRMTACDDDIGRRTTTQQPTITRWHGGGGSARLAAARQREVGGSLAAARRRQRRTAQRRQRGSCGGGGSATARRWWQLGGGATAAAASAAAHSATVAARWLRCAVEQKWVLWLHDLWWLEGGAAQVKGASNRQKNLQRHINRRDAQISTGTVHQRFVIFMYILTGTL